VPNVPHADRWDFRVDPRDPFGRAQIGVKISDHMRKVPPPPESRLHLRFPSGVEDLQLKRQDTHVARRMARNRLERYRHLLELGRRDRAEREAQRDFGLGCTAEKVIAEAEGDVARFAAQIEQFDREIACLLWEEVFPDAPTPAAYEELERRELAEGKQPLEFNHTDTMWEMIWSELVDAFADQGFAANAEILIAIQGRLGLGGACQLMVALRECDSTTAGRLLALVTEQEKRENGECYNRLMVRRAASGALLIVIDQPGNADYIPPLVKPPRFQPYFGRVRPQSRARNRASRGKSARTRGSRRASSRSSGSGSSDDPDPERPPLGGIERTRWEMETTAFGLALGAAVGLGLKGAAIGALVGWCWGRRRLTR
jgi:hypothetical protein